MLTPSLSCLLVAAAAAAPALPRPVSVDPRFEVTLVAAEPDIVTPIGLAVDGKGRLFVVESHTHFPPEGYAGPKHDRIKRFEDRDRDGTFETRTVFADDLQRTMHVALGPDGRLYAAERNAVLALDDRDGDGRADGRTAVLRLETEELYPHNGLGALAFGPDGFLYVGMGENMGRPYTLHGTDGRKESGGGEGGNVFRCRPDGTQLERVATGFWNPFALTWMGPRHFLVADNDPDARPPNRLLDVLPGADFGYRFRYGRDGVHPYQSLNGERPGTLPMAGPVGEAASGVLVAADTRLPGEYDDTLLVTSWGDHRIEAHRLRPAGGSLRAEMRALVTGGDDFRPVAIASGPDGSIYFTDWVDRSYNVHGKGRIWRMAPRKGARIEGRAKVVLAETPARKRVHALLAAQGVADAPAAVAALDDPDPFVHLAAAIALSRPALQPAARAALRDPRPRVRLGALLALRRGRDPGAAAHVTRALADPDESVRIAALMWAGEDRPLPGTRARAIDRALRGRPSADLVRIYAATAELLKVPLAPAASTPGDKQRLAALRQPASAPADVQRQRQTLWQLSTSQDPAVTNTLRELALDGRRDPQLRADAVAVLALLGAPQGLQPLYKDPDPVVSRAASRAFRQQNSDRIRPSDAAGWHRVASEGTGDPEAGRRLFFHPGIGCYRCHRVEGVGGRVGPDLSTIGQGMDTAKLVDSIVAPSREIAPENATRVLELGDGRTLEGIVEKQPDGSLLLRLAHGDPVRIDPRQIKSDTRSDVSLMPEGLQENMTLQDFRDLISFLLSRK